MRIEGKGTLVHCWEYKFVQPLWKVLWKFLKKLKVELAYNPVISLPGIYLKKMKIKTGYLKIYMLTIPKLN